MKAFPKTLERERSGCNMAAAYVIIDYAIDNVIRV